MLCYSACPIYGLEPQLRGTRGHRPGPALQPGLPRPGGAGAPGDPLQHDGIWQCTFVGECSKVCPRTWTPRGPSSGTSSSAAVHSFKTMLPWGNDERFRPRYTPHHPKWYRRRVSVWWWLQSHSYTGFVLRELTSVSVALFALVTLWQVRAMRRGPEAYDGFRGLARQPLFLVGHVVALLFVLFHSVTWFNLAPKAMVMGFGGRRCPTRSWRGRTTGRGSCFRGPGLHPAAGIDDETRHAAPVAPVQRGGNAGRPPLSCPPPPDRARLPPGWLEAPRHAALRGLVRHPLTRLYLFVFISLPLFHWAIASATPCTTASSSSTSPR